MRVRLRICEAKDDTVLVMMHSPLFDISEVDSSTISKEDSLLMCVARDDVMNKEVIELLERMHQHQWRRRRSLKELINRNGNQFNQMQYNNERKK